MGEGGTRYTLMKRNCGEGIKPDFNYSVKSFQCDIDSILPVSLSLAWKERYNLCMNRALMDHESLDCVL